MTQILYNSASRECTVCDFHAFRHNKKVSLKTFFTRHTRGRFFSLQTTKKKHKHARTRRSRELSFRSLRESRTVLGETLLRMRDASIVRRWMKVVAIKTSSQRDCEEYGVA
ncbi:hypothetical protein TNIN_127691 [Trichonephila inaurata madagascariensis]|uniref:Uncharacterized protein n=1 Tax=Trichonephila inaurata madagascariensis TaxID=2747483 RepID=A0A8X6YNY6_9ARAC|nr:hypothetical protein TNIN_127691 [Trichonephila inaurata madagascariensis]